MCSNNCVMFKRHRSYTYNSTSTISYLLLLVFFVQLTQYWPMYLSSTVMYCEIPLDNKIQKNVYMIGQWCIIITQCCSWQLAVAEVKKRCSLLRFEFFILRRLRIIIWLSIRGLSAATGAHNGSGLLCAPGCKLNHLKWRWPEDNRGACIMWPINISIFWESKIARFLQL